MLEGFDETSEEVRRPATYGRVAVPQPSVPKKGHQDVRNVLGLAVKELLIPGYRLKDL